MYIVLLPIKVTTFLRGRFQSINRNLYGQSQAETYKWDNGQGEAAFIIGGMRSVLRHGTRLYPD